MHESTLARRVLELALSHATGHGRVIAVHGRVSETESLSREALALHFATLARGTLASGATLSLAVFHARARCRACEHVWQPEHHLLLCPACGAVDAEELDPTGLWIERVEVEAQ